MFVTCEMVFFFSLRDTWEMVGNIFDPLKTQIVVQRAQQSSHLSRVITKLQMNSFLFQALTKMDIELETS